MNNDPNRELRWDNFDTRIVTDTIDRIRDLTHDHRSLHPYPISVIARYLHQIPHLDIRGREVNATFDPQDNHYLESLGILVALPGFWLIFTLLFFLIFFLCRCCDGTSKKPPKLTCCKCCLFLFALIGWLVLTVGLIGTLESHVGMARSENSTRNLANSLAQIRNVSFAVENLLEEKVDQELGQLNDLFGGHIIRNSTAEWMLKGHVRWMRSNVTKTVNRVGEVSKKLEAIDLMPFANGLEMVERYRFPGTLALMLSLILVCFILQLAVCKHSRCLLIFFSVLGLLCLVLCWLLTSLYTGMVVAGADFCVDPEPFIARQLSHTVEATVINFYMHCDPKTITNPFKKQLREASKSIVSVESDFNQVVRLCRDTCPDQQVRPLLLDISAQLNRTQAMITLLDHDVRCEKIHIEYATIMGSTCKNTLEGVALLLVSMASCGIIFTLLVLCASHTWINMRRKHHYSGDNAEELETFLPPPGSVTSTASSSHTSKARNMYGVASASGSRPRFSHTPPQTPHFPNSAGSALYGGQQQQTGNGRGGDQLAFLTSPPPAYEQVHHHPGMHHHYAGDFSQATKF